MDGTLPDYAISWHSDIDGDLGTGHDIHVDLSIGKHKITLRGVDSDGEETTLDITVVISHFTEQSYFPFPQDGFWKYQYAPSDLVVVNEKGETERWMLADMHVSVVDHTMRTCRMDWTVERDGEEMPCQYSLTDHLTTDGNRFLVTASEELLTILDGDEPVEELAVETIYTPSYPMLADYLDPRGGSGEEVTVTAGSTIKYTSDLSQFTREYTETFTVSCETASPENITTDSGTYTTIPFTSTYNGVERTWWLAQGIGIVKMEYDLFGETVTASLYETNMEDFAEAAGKRAPHIHSNTPIRIRVDSSAGTPERMASIMEVMRSMCPR